MDTYKYIKVTTIICRYTCKLKLQVLLQNTCTCVPITDKNKLFKPLMKSKFKLLKLNIDSGFVFNARKTNIRKHSTDKTIFG